jgi:hypothetical protein
MTIADADAPAKGGRPRRYAEGRPTITVRVTPQRHAEMIETSKKNGRSLSEEAELRIEHFERLTRVDAQNQTMLVQIDDHLNQIRELQQQVAKLKKDNLALQGEVGPGHAASNDQRLANMVAIAVRAALAEKDTGK